MPFGGLLTVGLISSGTGILGGLLGNSAAKSAADAQESAAFNAGQFQYQNSQDALNFNKLIYGNQQAQLAPYLATGQSSLANLANLLGVLPSGATFSQPNAGGGASQPSAADASKIADLQSQIAYGKAVLAGQNPANAQGGHDWAKAPHNPGTIANFQNYITNAQTQLDQLQQGASNAALQQGGTQQPLSSLVNPDLGAKGSLLQPFQAPTALDEQNDPGYQARLKLGQQALENSAAAKGGLLSGGTAKALDQYGQDFASNEYGNVYNRSFNTFETNQTNTYNRLASLAGLGQTSAQLLGQAGQSAAANNSNIDLTAGQQVGQNINNAGAARASGYVGGNNAISGMLSGLGNNATSLYFLSKLFGGGGGGGDSLFSSGFAPSSIDPNIGAPQGWGQS